LITVNLASQISPVVTEANLFGDAQVSTAKLSKIFRILRTNVNSLCWCNDQVGRVTPNLKTKRSIVMAQNQDNKSERGFASMSEEERREIARKGGESVPDEKRSFSQDRELASEAGRKGGESRGQDK
jgi:general stress protein YciG